MELLPQRCVCVCVGGGEGGGGQPKELVRF